MSIESMSWALNLTDERITPTEKLVLIGIANHDGDGGAWPSINTLARYAGCIPRSATRAVAKLESIGYVKRGIQEGGTQRMRKTECPNLYVIHRDPPVRTDTHPPVRTDTHPPVRTDTQTVLEPSNEPIRPSPDGEETLALEAAEKFWARYPSVKGRKRAKAKVIAKFVSLCSQGKLDQIREGFIHWDKVWRDPEERKYAPAPWVWLNDGWWEADAIKQTPTNEPTSWLLEQGRQTPSEAIDATQPDWL